MRASPLLGAAVALSAFSSYIPSSHRTHFSCGKLYYRTMLLDEAHDKLYIGAMDAVFRLSSKNVNRSRCSTNHVSLEPDDTTSCVARGGSEDYECRNHIRALHAVRGELLYVCGTNAQNPRDWLLSANLVDFSSLVPTVGTGAGRCAFGPDDHVTSVWVERGNPGHLQGLYSGTVLDFTKTDRGIIRSDLINYETLQKSYDSLRTVRYDKRWLNGPEFVSSFAIGDYVYFFFRELAVEYSNCGKVIYSRVARVCKKDVGAGKSNLNNVWATFIKARLNCSIPGDFPFYFNEIRSVFKSDEDDMFYAVFSTPTNGIFGSAVCAFSLKAINQAFSGPFKGQKNWDSAWLPVTQSKVPKPRPGTCVNDTMALPELMLLFQRNHPLMHAAVSSQGSRPIHFEPNVVFTSIAVHRKKRVNALNALIFYVGSSDGHVYKILQGGSGSDEPLSYIADEWCIANEPIRRLEISQKLGMLYVASDSGITQINLYMCEQRYDEEEACERDPYCSWDPQLECISVVSD